MSSLTALVPNQLVGGQFRIVRPLGTGGMGIVYVAEQLSTGRLRALKVMRAQEPDADASRRFQREARVGALVQSEHIVDVIDAGIDEGSGSPWIAMELLEGLELGQYLERNGPLSLERAGEVLRQLCAGLGAAHDNGLIHRDIKPANVFLARSTTHEAGFVLKLLDFGIAKQMGNASATSSAIGSPMWMAPEQTEPNPALTCSADVWSLGLLAFRMIVGHPYWHTARTGELSALLREILIEPLAPASERAADFGCSALPAGFDEWFSFCVARAPEARFPTARQAWASFQQLLMAPGELQLSAPVRSSVRSAVAVELPASDEALSEPFPASGAAATQRSSARSSSVEVSPTLASATTASGVLDAATVQVDCLGPLSAETVLLRPSEPPRSIEPVTDSGATQQRRRGRTLAWSVAVAAAGAVGFAGYWALHRAPSATRPSSSSQALGASEPAATAPPADVPAVPAAGASLPAAASTPSAAPAPRDAAAAPRAPLPATSAVGKDRPSVKPSGASPGSGKPPEAELPSLL